MTKFQIFIILYFSFHLVQSERILLENIKELTLYKGRPVKGRRLSPIQQINCVGGSAKCSFQLHVMKCYNRGSDGIDIQWECNSEMPKEYKLGALNVLCEGYTSPDDPYILNGSCGVEYNLELTEIIPPVKVSQAHSPDSSPTVFMWTLIIIFLIVVIIILICSVYNNNDHPTSTTWTTDNTRADRSPVYQPIRTDYRADHNTDVRNRNHFSGNTNANNQPNSNVKHMSDTPTKSPLQSTYITPTTRPVQPTSDTHVKTPSQSKNDSHIRTSFGGTIRR